MKGMLLAVCVVWMMLDVGYVKGMLLAVVEVWMMLDVGCVCCVDM
jgi:hypothetical protein